MSSRCPWIFKTVCLPISSLCLHIWLGLSSLYFIYSYLPKICVFTFYSPCSFRQPSNCFHSFFSLFPFSLCLRLTSLYIPFISPRCLSLPFMYPCLFHFPLSFIQPFYLFYLSSFISFHYFSHTFTLPLFVGPCISLICFGYFLDSFIQFLCLFYLSQFLHWSSHLTFLRLPSVNWCTLPAWCRLGTCPYASHGARMARRSCPLRASLSTRRSSWAPSRYRRCRSSTMATTPALPAMMLPLSAQRGSSRLQVRKERAQKREYERDI